MPCPTPPRPATLGCLALAMAIAQPLALALATAPAAQIEPRVEPVPVAAAAGLRTHNGRSPISFSPDGEWIVHTVASADTVPRGASYSYSATGVPFAEGDSRMEATVSNTRTGASIRIGGAYSSSWAGVWSPDGDRVAFYSDEGGEAGVWIWNRASEMATRVPGVIARPFFGFEMLRWSGDGQRLLAKVLPEGVTIAEANRLSPRTATGPRFAPVADSDPSVFVRRSAPATPSPANPAPANPAAATDKEADTPAPDVRQDPVGYVERDLADLVIIDLVSGAATRVLERIPARAYAWSPDERHVAYTVLKGWEPNTQQSNYDLRVYDIATGSHRVLGTNVRMSYGIEWSWAPDSRRIAYFDSGQLSDGATIVIDLESLSTHTLQGEGVPGFSRGEGEIPPLWDESGTAIYAIGDAALWRVNVDSGASDQVGASARWQMRALVASPGTGRVWSPDGRTLWVLAQDHDGSSSAILSIDSDRGEVTTRLSEAKSYSPSFNLDASAATGAIAFVSRDQQHLSEVWVFDPDAGQSRRVATLNDALDRYRLGEVRIIDWRSTHGDPLRGALLLPPDYQEGPLPLVVFAYGGEYGSRSVNRFGFWGEMPTFNMHLLATRGYAVLYPDAPLRVGMSSADLMATVMPGVNAAIDLGFADPERLAIMGQSYGSYCTLAIITQTDRFKAAVVTAAVLHPDLFADYLGGTGYYEQGQGNMGATIWEEPNRYLENSPLFRFDRIETPLLIGQGELDGDLVPAEATFTALERLGKTVEYRLYEGEGHVISRLPNVVDFWERRLEFLAEHLELEIDDKGRVTPGPAAAIEPR